MHAIGWHEGVNDVIVVAANSRVRNLKSTIMVCVCKCFKMYHTRMHSLAHATVVFKKTLCTVFECFKMSYKRHSLVHASI